MQIVTGEEIELQRRAVPSEWIDYNGHMNVAYYLLAADNAYDVFLEYLGVEGDAVAERGAISTFALENHIAYIREMMEGDPFKVTLQLLDRDHKRIHYMLNLHQTRDDYHAAAVEGLSSFVDMQARRTAEMPPEIAARLEEVWRAHKDIAWPVYAGRKMGIRRKGA